MLSTIFRKKLSDEQLANVFVNGVLSVIDKGFQEVMELISFDAAFEKQPDLSGVQDGHFTMIVVVANLSYLGDSFPPQQVSKIEEKVVSKFADAFEMDLAEFEKHLADYRSFMSRVNHPSKNMHYAMAKSIFHKYKLNDYQDEYFRNMASPNPLFLKRMDEVTENFIWNWEAFFKRFKMVS